jgi:hypothetical protein
MGPTALSRSVGFLKVAEFLPKSANPSNGKRGGLSTMRGINSNEPRKPTNFAPSWQLRMAER